MTLKYVVCEMYAAHTEKHAFHFNNVLFAISFYLRILPKHYLHFNVSS